MPKPRSGTSYRLSENAQELLGRLACHLGLTKTSVLEMAIRKLAYGELGMEEVGVILQRHSRLRQNSKAMVADHKN